MFTRSNGARIGAAALAAMLLAACGSTLPPETRRAAALRGGGDGFGAEADEAAGDGTGAGSEEGTASGAAGPFGEGSDPTPEEDDNGDGPGPRRPPDFKSLPMGKGVTADTILLGVPYIDQASVDSAARGAGLNREGGPPVAPRNPPQAVIDYVNNSGGIAGRKIQPVWFESSVQNLVTPEGRARDAEAACATFTEDNKVFAFLDIGTWTQENILDCAVRSKTPFIGGYGGPAGIIVSEQRFAEIDDYYFHMSGLLAERRERAIVASLARQGFFTPGAKVGLMVHDERSIRQGVDRGMKPALAALGVQVAAEARYPDILESPWATYVFDFQRQGVTHVIFSASTAENLPVSSFMNAAQDQRTSFLYGISGKGGVRSVRDNANKAQLKNAYGFNWAPHLLYDGPSPVGSPADAACREAMKKKGLNENPNLVFGFCDFFFFLKHALERSDALTAAGLKASVERLGTSWQSATTFGGATRFGRGRHDGVAMVRDFRWDEARNAWRYTSEAYPAP